MAEPVPPDDKDRDLINKILELDWHIEANHGYGEYEELLMYLEGECEERFEKWLRDKGGTDKGAEVAKCIPEFLRFIYGYNHTEVVTIDTLPLYYIFDVFFTMHLFDNVKVEPAEYLKWPPAIRLFHVFLQEKGYIDYDLDIFMEDMDEHEPVYFELILEGDYKNQ